MGTCVSKQHLYTYIASIYNIHIYSIEFYKEELRFKYALIMIIALENIKVVTQQVLSIVYILNIQRTLSITVVQCNVVFHILPDLIAVSFFKFFFSWDLQSKRRNKIITLANEQIGVRYLLFVGGVSLSDPLNVFPKSLAHAILEVSQSERQSHSWWGQE